MMTSLPHITSMLTTPWCGWTLLVLMLFAILAEWIQPGVISQAYTSLKVRTERMYKDAPTSGMAQILITAFRIGTLAMIVCMCFAPNDRLTFVAYMAVCGVILAILMVKMICNILLNYAFQITRIYGDVYEHYSNIFTLTIVAMFPLVLLFLHIGSITATRCLLGVMAVLFLVMWLYRCVRQFIHAPLAIIYLLTYMITLEILPMVGLLLFSEKTLSIL